MMEVVRSGPRAIVPIPEPVVPLGLLGRIQKALTPRAGPSSYPNATYGSGGAMGMVYGSTALNRPPGLASFRQYAQTPWVFAALNIRKDQVSTAEWDIVPFDNTKRYAARQRDRLLELFDQPGPTLNSFQSFAKVVLNELLIADGAPVEKVRTPGGDIGELWPILSDFIQIDGRWDGSDPDKVRYYFIPDGTVRATFKNEDLVYLISNERAGSPYGISPIGVLATVIESELQGIEYNRRQVMGAAPDGVLNIGENASAEDVLKAESKFRGEVFGQGAMAVLGGFKTPTWMPFRSSNREMQFREWQDYLIRCIATVLGLSPMDLAITFDVNRSTADAQGSNTEDRGLRPLMATFQRFMTTEIVWDKSFGGRANNLQFVFKSLNLDETEQKANINKIAMPGIGWKSINEARSVDGRAPLGDPQDDDNLFNHILIGTPTGILDLNTQTTVGAEAAVALQTQSKIDLAEAVAEANPQPEPSPAEGDKR